MVFQKEAILCPETILFKVKEAQYNKDVQTLAIHVSVTHISSKIIIMEVVIVKKIVVYEI